MKKSLYLLMSAMLTSVAAMAQNQSEIQRFAFNKGDFGSLRVIDNISVEYICNPDSAGYIVFECAPEAAPQLLFSNDKFTLKIQQQDAVTPMHLPRVRVYSGYLSSVENSGDSTVYITSVAPAAEISLRVVGNGRIVANNLHAGKVEGKIDTGRGSLVLGGETSQARLRTVGTGSIKAGALKAKNAHLTMSGTGSVDCWVTDELYIKGLGSGKVYVKGNPAVKNRTLGTVKVISMNQQQ